MMNAKGMERKELRRQVQATFTTHSPPKPALFAAITMCLSLHRNWTSKSTSPTLDTKPTNGLPIHLQGPQGKPLQVPSFLLHHLKHTLKTPRKKVSQSEPETPFSVPFLFLIILMDPHRLPWIQPPPENRFHGRGSSRGQQLLISDESFSLFFKLETLSTRQS